MRMSTGYGSQLVMLSAGAQLFAHHLEGDTYNFSAPLAEVVTKPLGLRNLSSDRWSTRTQDGSTLEVKYNEVLPVTADCHIHFGKTEADVRTS
jgi:hypothetical protein